jgi:catechol-2,3-dioxygenase
MPDIHVIQVNVPDMDKALDFYCAQLGFEILAREFYPKVVVLAHTPMIVLNQDERFAQGETPPPYHLAVAMPAPSLAQCLDELRERGVGLVHETVQNAEYGAYFDVRDPAGNVISIVRYGQAPT